MKIRKALAVVLSLAMTVTLMPATAFATTKNTASTAVTVGDGDPIPASYVELEVSNAAGISDASTKELAITLNLDNAKWTTKPDSTATNFITGEDSKKVTVKDGPVLEFSPNKTDSTVVIDECDASRIEDDSITLTFKMSGALLKKDVLTVSFPENVLTADGDEGAEVTVEIDPSDDRINAGTYTIATISGGGTTATVSGSVKGYATRTSNVEAAEVTIKENSAVAISDKSVHVLKMQLPKGVEWDKDGTNKVAALMKISGGLFVIPEDFTEAKGITSSSDLLEAATKGKTVGNTTYAKYATGYYVGGTEDATGEAYYYLTNDDRTLYVALVAHGTAARQSAYITPSINITKTASDGDVTLSISDTARNPKGTGEFTSDSGLVIAKVGTEGVTVSTVAEDELPTIVAGQITDIDNEYFWAEVKLTEAVSESLTTGKDVDFEFADGVQVLNNDNAAGCPGVKVSCDKNHDLDNFDKAGELATTKAANKFVVDYGNDDENIYDDNSEVSITIPSQTTAADYGNKKFDIEKANTVIVYFPLTVRADVTGDVTVKVSGKDFDDTTLTVAKAVAPLTVTTTVTDVVNGAKSQALADITVKENVAGYVGRNSKMDEIRFQIETGGIENGYALDGASVKVTEGDLELKSTVHYAKGDMWVVVDDASTTASTFVISGVVLNLSRTLAEGPYNLELSASDDFGNAVVENQAFNKGKFGGDNDFDINVATTPYINITTAADTAQTGIVANFYLDGSKNSTYTVNLVDNTMDAAAYLDSNNRTMVPIRYVAYALGLKDTDISYNVGDSTATLSGLTNVVKVTTGSNVLQASNGNVTMDTVAVNNSGRLYVPARFIAQAMGAQVAWDQATKTVTITK